MHFTLLASIRGIDVPDKKKKKKEHVDQELDDDLFCKEKKKLTIGSSLYTYIDYLDDLSHQ